MELDSYFLFLQEQIKDIIIIRLYCLQLLFIPFKISKLQLGIFLIFLISNKNFDVAPFPLARSYLTSYGRMLADRVGGHRRGSPRYSYNEVSAGFMDGDGYPRLLEQRRYQIPEVKMIPSNLNRCRFEILEIINRLERAQLSVAYNVERWRRGWDRIVGRRRRVASWTYPDKDLSDAYVAVKNSPTEYKVQMRSPSLRLGHGQVDTSKSRLRERGAFVPIRGRR
jgi:hypothetical protein